MKKNNALHLISTMLVTYGALCALLTVFLQYIPYYTKVLAPVPYRQGFLRPMVLVGFTVFAAVMALAWGLRRKFELSPYLVGIPGILLGTLTALLPIATPSGISDLLAKKVHWLTPTLVGNGLTAAYVFFVATMLLGGITAVMLLFRHSYVNKKDTSALISYPILMVLVGITAGLVAVILPNKIGYDATFHLAGIVCAVCSLLSLMLGWKKSKFAS